MSGQSDDEHLYDIELSETSDESSTDNTQENQDQSPEQAAVTESISTTGSYLAGTTPVGEVIPIPGLNSTEAPSSTINSGWTTEPTSSTQLASTSQPIESPAAGNKTYIHPISEGGSVTWKDHNEFVFHKGKDRGSRPPAPTLPADYKSKGPLPNFDFSKLRGNNARKEPVTKFLDDYSGKQEQVPTELVTKIMVYYNENEDNHLKYLTGRSLKIQGLNDAIRAQEQEISTIKEALAETNAVKKYSEERGEKIKELSQDLKDREETINNLRFKINELEEGNFPTKDSESEETIKGLMLRITELEEAARGRMEEGSTTSQDPDSEKQEKKIKQLNRDVRDREDTINDLFHRIHGLEEAVSKHKEESSKPYRVAREIRIRELDENPKYRENTISVLSLRIHELEEAAVNRKEEGSTTSRDPDSAKQEKRNRELNRDVRDREDIINDLFRRIHGLEEAVRKHKEERSKPYRVAREKKIKEQDENIKDKENTISALHLRIHEFEEADRAREEARSKTSQAPAGASPVPSAKKLIESAKAIKASLLEAKVRCLLLQAKNYIDNEEHQAAADLTAQAEVIMRLELPHLQVLYGKVLFRNGRAMYEMGFLPEAIRDLTRALTMGFDANCGEVDGDCVRPWLLRAKAAHREAIRLGYPA